MNELQASINEGDRVVDVKRGGKGDQGVTIETCLYGYPDLVKIVLSKSQADELVEAIQEATKEKKYRVIFKRNGYRWTTFLDYDGEVYDTDDEIDIYVFNREQIEAIDPRYMAFAEEV